MTNRVRLPVAAAIGIFTSLVFSQAAAQDDINPLPALAEIVEAWLASPHADRTAEAFTHWNEDGEIPGTCAVCHSSAGIIDYLGAPITTTGVIDHPVTLGTTVDCAACHNASAIDLATVPFPSGASVDSFGASAVCTVCHQGRASGISVANAVSGIDDDVISGDLGFINIHYVPSAASVMGGVVQGGFEYPDKTYKGQFTHVPDLNSCVGCHLPHSLEVKLDSCTTCHQNAARFEDIRITPTDFDGDGDITEGIAGPVETFHDQLEQAIQRYAAEVLQAPVVYEITTYPYFFADTDGDGTASESEVAFPNRYQNWTPRLLQAAYNYQLVAKEQAIYTHNPHYALQLLYDSIESLSERVTVDMSDLTRP